MHDHQPVTPELPAWAPIRGRVSVAPGARLGPYEVVALLGAGGMGEVYKARDTRLDRTVAIKVLPPHISGDPAARERFEREARTASSLNHPQICTLYDIGREAGFDFLVLEHLEGETLAGRLARGPLPLHEAIATALGLLAALEALHGHGLVHRDLKPANLFLTTHGVKLLDFGLARPVALDSARTAAGLTLAGTITGTPAYMAPEVLRGEAFDGRADLFAVGAILYEMATGTPAFARGAVAEIVQAVTQERPPNLTGPAAVVALDRVIHRALAKRPDDRSPTAASLAQELREILLRASDSGRTAQARPVTRFIALPFRVLREDPETDFLAFSLPDAVTSSLSGFDSLAVRSTVAALPSAGGTPDLRALAREADIDIVLVGSLLRAGDRIRVSCQLLEAPSGTVVWTHSALATLGDIFDLQEEVCRRIVESLSLPLAAREGGPLRRDMPASAKAYELYLRANELSYDSKSWAIARDLYLRCLEEDPHYAPAWARLGRIYRLLGKYHDDEPQAHLARAESAFRRALEINPDLPLAHNLHAHLEVDLGHAQDTMVRLVARAKKRAGDPELFAGIVHACRYCGLLDASLAAHREARRLDPNAATSIANTLFQLGEYGGALAEEIGDNPYLGALSLLALGRDREAAELLLADEAKGGRRSIARDMRLAVRHIAEGNREPALEVIRHVADAGLLLDPEGVFYIARVLARLGDAERAVPQFARAVEGGFFCFPGFMRDRWLDPLRGLDEFARVLRHAEARHREARSAFLQSGGDLVVGLDARV